MRLQKGYRRGIAVIALLLLASFARAIKPVPLPGLQLTSAAGQTVKNTDLPSQGNWVLIYIQPKSQFSDNLLRLMKRDLYPNLEQHAVVIVGGSLDDLKNTQAKYPDLSQASWYADTDKSAYGQLQLHGVPVVLGLKQQTIEWSLNGVLPDSNVSRSVLNTWINQP